MLESSPPQFRPDLNAIGLEFVKTDLGVALTFAHIALQANGDSHKKLRNQANARKAYDAVITWMNRLTINETDAVKIGEKLHKLRSTLKELGELL